MKYIAYYRVSTKKQGQSGLGLEAQRASVLAFLEHDWNAKSENGEGHVPAPDPYSPKSRARKHSPEPFLEFVEIESGKRVDRPQLEKAISACRVYKAKLVIARIDRLSRNAHFLLGLKEAGIDFVAADMPNANHLTVGIMAMVAEDVGRSISLRIKEALAAARKSGLSLAGIMDLFRLL